MIPDRTTDVLSFAFQDDEDMILDSKMPTELGDILISYETMIRQADDYGHSTEREMCFLFTHGLLHLLGYDHIKDSDKAIMRKAEEDIMTKVKLERD